MPQPSPSGHARATRTARARRRAAARHRRTPPRSGRGPAARARRPARASRPGRLTALASFSQTRGTAAKKCGRTRPRYAPIWVGSGQRRDLGAVADRQPVADVALEDVRHRQVGDDRACRRGRGPARGGSHSIIQQMRSCAVIAPSAARSSRGVDERGDVVRPDGLDGSRRARAGRVEQARRSSSGRSAGRRRKTCSSAGSSSRTCSRRSRKLGVLDDRDPGLRVRRGGRRSARTRELL